MQQVQRDHVRLLDNLKTLQKIYTAKELSKFLGISEGTWRNRMKEPWRLFCYDDFKLLSKFCRVDLMQLLEGELKVR